MKDGSVTNINFMSQPIMVGRLKLKHRLALAPMGAMLFTDDSDVTQRLIDYYAAQARGGSSMVTIGGGQIDPRTKGWPHARMDEDRYIPGLRRVAEVIHAEGVPAIMQLMHVGPNCAPPISPSGISCLSQTQGFITPRAMTLEEIEVVRDGFIAGAVRAKQAGYDGITLAGQGTYLLMQFHSPRMNVRTDRYGGSPEKRMTLALEIVRGIRRECGPGFILGYGMVADELMPGGIEIEHSVPFAVALEQEGVDYIDVRVGHQESYTTTERATGHSRHHKRTGIWGDYAEHFKKALKVPVFCSTQGCYDPAQWEQALQKGQVDVIQIAKPLLADHDLPNKVLEGRAKDVRPCVLCLFCVDVTTNDMYCTVNPELGHETKMAIRPALDSKKVMVVGGGPAGLEAARVAALRGHQVTVIEKQADLGGNLLTLSICPGGDIYLGLRDWLVRQCAGAGVKFEVGKTANVQVVRKERPDVVIAAVGAPAILLPPVPGIDKPHVVTAIDVLHGKAALGKDIVVLGGGMIGVDTALAFAIRGGIHNITIIETLRVPTLAYDESFLERTYTTMTLLPKYSIRGISGICVDEITNNQVVISDQDGKRQKIKADTVVIAMGFKPNPSLYEALRAENVELYTIGDCVRPQSVGEAMHDAAGVARQI